MSTFASVLVQPQPATVVAGKRQTVLIIDDDDVLAEVLARRLKHHGFDTLTAGSGELGLEKARSERPDLIVLDLRLPDADGLSICQQLADSPETCTVPVIIISGLEAPDILRRCRAAGCHYFVHKPHDPSALLILIRHAIREAASWDECDG